MCLIALALEAHPHVPLVIASNRDEYHDRPTAALDCWRPGNRPVLSGRDLQAGGTWLGLGARGRWALVTNLRRPGSQRPGAPSRGRLVPTWLTLPIDAPTFAAATAAEAPNPCNVLFGRADQGAAWWLSTDRPHPQPLATGLHDLSNGELGAPWPKQQRLRGALARRLDGLGEAPGHAQLQSLAATLLDDLADDQVAPDALLPRTGVPQDVERWLSSVFIRSPSGHYGTRSSAVVVVERTTHGLTAHMVERRYDAQGRPQGETRARWPAWDDQAGGAEPSVDNVITIA